MTYEETPGRQAGMVNSVQTLWMLDDDENYYTTMKQIKEQTPQNGLVFTDKCLCNDMLNVRRLGNLI
jgi:hypothetical protein